MRKTYKGDITLTNIPNDGIFVFGSNTQGRHGKGAARFAKDNFGAIYGQARGLQGKSYAICTKDLTKEYQPSIIPSKIIKEIKDLYNFALKNPNLLFYIPYKGKGENLNGYSCEQMARMFATCEEIPNNIIFEEEFCKLVEYYLPFLNTKDLVVVINGSRQFNDYSLLEEECYKILNKYIEEGKNIIIREGNASGADTLAARFANENNFKLEVYKAEWDKFGKGAGFLRNIDMIKGKDGDKPMDIMIAFNMNTPGTNHALKYAKEHTIFTSIYEIKLY